MRSYSIASSPSASATIELAVERLNDGEVSTFFHDVVTVGDSIDLRGPLGGHFVWSPSDSRSILLIGGGSGAVPLISMVRERHAAGASAPMTLLYSARAWRDVLYPDELLGYAAAAGGVSLAFALTRDAPVRNLDFGRRIDAAMVAAVLARGTQAAELAYVCGTNAFVDAAADAAIAAGIPQAVIRTERYGA
jgi:ferredoxin-NADP reductase